MKVVKVNLHEKLKRHAYQHALISTFVFDARFFEQYAIEKFRSLQENGNITIVLDGRIYDELLDAVATDGEAYPKSANLRYLLHPVRVPGCFHPKIFLFADDKRGLLIIGSANFTESGLGSNAEFVSIFEYEEGRNESALFLFQAAFRFFEDLLTRWPGDHFESNVREMAREAPWLVGPPADNPPKTLPSLLTNLDEPLWNQLVKRLSDRPVKKLSVLSRYFDSKPDLLGTVAKSIRAAKVSLYTQNYITTLTKEWLRHPAFKSGDLDIRLCNYTDEGHAQRLHGKAYAFDSGKEVIIAAGSANFTTPALLKTAETGNVEVLLCYPPMATRVWSINKWFDAAGNGIVLRNESDLETAKHDPDEPKGGSHAYSITLVQAHIDEPNLLLHIDGGLTGTDLTARVTQANKRAFLIPVRSSGKQIFTGTLDESQLRLVRESATIAQMGTGSGEKWKPISNPLFIANLLEISTGDDVRRRRQIREACESPQRFMDVLTTLSKSDDEERLKQFLTYCDIPIDLLSTHLYRLRRKPGQGRSEGDPMRELGRRNLRYFEVLHDAVMHFVERHRKRLDRHIESGTAKGIPNFLHILLTIAKLIVSQIDRLIFALEAEITTELQPKQWFSIRGNLDDYYRVLDQLLQITAVDYLNVMIVAAPRNEVVPAFSDALPDLLAVYARAIDNRGKLDGYIKSRRVSVRNLDGVLVLAEYFKSVLGESNWTNLVDHIQKMQRLLVQHAAA